MKIARSFATLGALGLASAAFAQPACPAGSQASSHTNVASMDDVTDTTPGNQTISFGWTAATFQRIHVSGRLTAISEFTYASEARFRVTFSDSTFITLQPSTLADVFTQVDIADYIFTLPAVRNTSEIVSVMAYESFDDEEDTADSNWDAVCFTFDNVAATPPSGAIDFGSLAAGVTVSDSHTYSVGEVRWYKFTVPAIAAASNTFLDLWSSGGPGAPFVDNDVDFMLFSNTGGFLLYDDLDGDAFAPSMSFGLTTPTRPNVGTGLAHNGRDGSLAAGTYWLAVAGYQSTCSGGWTVSTDTTDSGDATVYAQYGTNTTPTPPSVALAESPDPAPSGVLRLFTATVTPGTNPTSSGISVTANHSTAGGSPTASYHDDGLNGDVTAGDNIFSYQAVVTASPATYTLPVSVQDAQLRTASGNHTLIVIPPPPANDECTGAFAANPGSNAYDQGGSTTSPEVGCGGIGTDVWFSYNAAGGPVQIDTCGGTSADTVIAVYDGCGGALLACNDQACASNQSSVTVCAATGQNLRIRIGMFVATAASSGTFNITELGTTSPTVNVFATNCAAAGETVTVEADVVRACPIGATLSVTGNAAALNAGSFSLADDGIAPDVTAADGTYTGSFVVGAGASSGNVSVNVVDGAANASDSAAVSVPSTDTVGDSIATAVNASSSPINGEILVNCTDGDDADVYRIYISNPAAFSATTFGTVGLADSQLFVFRPNGIGVVSNDDIPDTLPGDDTNLSTLPAGSMTSSARGTYYLAISGYNKDPQDASAQLLWANTPFNTVRVPDGPGAANALAGWTSDTFASSGAYSIILTGIGCPADIDNDGNIANGLNPDGGVDINDLLTFLAGFEAGDPAVDLDNNGDPLEGVQDGGVDINDLLFFLAHFEAGC